MNRQADFTEVADIESAFYQAFRELDLDLMDRIWSEDPETVCVHPGGDLLSGKSAVLQSWAEIFASAQAPSVEYRTLQITSSGDLEIHLVEERIHPGGAQKGKASRVLATNIFRHNSRGWHLLAHHASLPVMRPRANKKDSSAAHLH